MLSVQSLATFVRETNEIFEQRKTLYCSDAAISLLLLEFSCILVGVWCSVSYS